MQSFYGGRQGASFVLVKRFDGIDIPQVEGKYVFKRAYFAIDDNDKFIVDNGALIRKDGNNYDKYRWGLHKCDGTLIEGATVEESYHYEDVVVPSSTPKDQNYLVYNITSQKGIDIAKSLAVEDSYTAPDGTIWSKRTDGSIWVTNWSAGDVNSWYPTKIGSTSSSGTIGENTPIHSSGGSSSSSSSGSTSGGGTYSSNPGSKSSSSAIASPGNYTWTKKSDGTTETSEDNEEEDNDSSITTSLAYTEGSKDSVSALMNNLTNSSGERFPYELAEGMIQYFRKGSTTLSEVNYGEYVIIDTTTGLGRRDHPDNGKIFRRGLDIENEYGGGIFVGTVVGPKGDSPELRITSYEAISAIEDKKESSWTVDTKDLVPGYDGQTFEDKIKYSYATIKDELGNTTGCLIGMRMPTLVIDYEAKSVSPYLHRQIGADGKYYNTDLVTQDLAQYNPTTGKWHHPFYEKWQISVPHGYHGTNISNLEKVHTYTLPKGFREGYAGTPLYTDSACTKPYVYNGSPIVLETAFPLEMGHRYDSSKTYAIVRYNNRDLYVKQEDCYRDIVRYKETNFDNVEEGESNYISVGTYNDIRYISLSDDGFLNVYYSSEEEPQKIDRPIRWIDTENGGGITFAADGTVTIDYNTIDDQGKHESYQTVLNWIDQVKVTGDGTVNFYYNSDHENPAYSFDQEIKYLKDIFIDTDGGDGYEGSGDQKLKVQWNTDNSIEAIGAPLNYVVETCISVPNETYPNVPASHLMVYYSDPELRKSLKDKWVTYPSTKVIDGYDNENKPIYHVWNEWVDLGVARGPAGGVHTLKNVKNLDELKKQDGSWAKPEELIVNGELATWAYGWSVTYTPENAEVAEIWFYDYDIAEWYKGGEISFAAIDPTYTVVMSSANSKQLPMAEDSVENLRENGLWFGIEKTYFAL